MNYLGRLFSSAQQYYKNINVANLTGAIDVIVVKNKDGEYQSTPFYVRFGKMGVLYPQAHLVDICINGQPRPDLCMHVGPTGYARFGNQECKLKTEKTESPLTSNEELQTWENHTNDHIDSGTSESNAEQLENIFDLDIQEISTSESSKHTVESSKLQSNIGEVSSSGQKDCLLNSHDTAEVDKGNMNRVTLKDLVKYLQNTNNWPNEFYIYHVLNKSVNSNNSFSNDSQVNKAAKSNFNSTKQTNTSTKVKSHRSKFFSRKLSVNCELVYPEDFLKFETDKVPFDSVWIVWSSSCMSGETAALILLRNLSQMERSILLERDSLRVEYNIVLEQHKRDRGSESPVTSLTTKTPEICDPGNQSNQPIKDKSSWLWWRSRKNQSEVSSDLGSQDLVYQDTSHKQAVQSILPPIDLGISSPVAVQEEFDHENYEHNEHYLNSPATLSKGELLNIPTATIPRYSSTIDVRYRSNTPDPLQIPSSPEEAGYFSDEGDHNSVYQKRTGDIERGISIQQENHLTSEQLKSLNLHEGANEAVFSVVSKYQGTCQCACFIYLWDSSDKIVISDIDGTITKSDWLGQLMPLVGMDWTHSHIAHLYDKIAHNGYKFIYLSSRPIGQARATRKLLHAIQQDNYRLPDGPILLSPFSVLEAFRKEVILKRADEHKIECLREVCGLFSSGDGAKDQEENIPFVAGFGNRPTDIATYKAVGLEDHQIFTVDYLGNVICGDPGKEKKASNTNPNPPTCSPKLDEAVECVSSSMTATRATSFTTSPTRVTTVYSNSVLAKLNLDALLQMADVYFPQMNDRLIYATNYSDYTYWRI